MHKMDINLEIRKRQLENLKHFIFSSVEKTNSIIEFMGWDASKVLEDNGLVQCSIQSSHRMPKSSVTKHVSKCIFRQEGYTSDDEFLSEPSDCDKSSIYITNDTKAQLFSQAQKNVTGFKSGWINHGSDPRTSDRLTSTFTKDERLILYNYAINNTDSLPPLPEFDVSAPKPERPLSYEEKLILERNAKRRRIKHKAVHTNKKSYTEVIKEVIDGQMKLYEEWCTGSSSLPETSDNEKTNKRDNEKTHGPMRHKDSDRDSYKRHSRSKTYHKSREESEYNRRNYFRNK